MIKAEAQRSRDEPRASNTQKSRVRVTPSSPNTLFDDGKDSMKAKLDEKEALKALKEEEKELASEEDDTDEDDEDDDEDDDDDEDEDGDDGYDNEDEDVLLTPGSIDDGDSSDEDDIADEEELMTDCPDYCRCSGQYAAATTAK